MLTLNVRALPLVRSSSPGIGDSSDAPYEVQLEFPKVVGADAAALAKQIIIGSCQRVAGKDSSPVTFDVTLPAGTTLFALDTPKGTVAPGATQKVGPHALLSTCHSACGSIREWCYWFSFALLVWALLLTCPGYSPYIRCLEPS